MKRECEEMRKMGRNKKKKKETASNRQKNLKRREGLVAKLLVI